MRETLENTEFVVREMLTEMDAALRAGDVDRALQFAADDIISMPPDQDPVIGKAAQRAWSHEFFGSFLVDLVHEPLETDDLDEVVIHRGNLTGTLTPKAGGEPIVLNNKYLFVLRRNENDELRVWRSIFNTNAPS